MSGYGLATFALAYFLAVASPGPGVAAVIAQSLARGARGAPAFILGFVVGDLSWFAAASLGLSALANSAHWAFMVVKYAGAAYLLYLAYRLWTTPARSLDTAATEQPQQPPLKLFLGSLTLTLSNPKVMIFFLALLPSVVSLETMSRVGFFEIAATITVVLPATLGLYVAVASRARTLFRDPNSVRLVNRGSGTLLAAAAVAVATR